MNILNFAKHNTRLCVIVGEGSNCKSWGKNPQVHNLDNIPPGAFYSTPTPPLTIRHKRVIINDAELISINIKINKKNDPKTKMNRCQKNF